MNFIRQIELRHIYIDNYLYLYQPYVVRSEQELVTVRLKLTVIDPPVHLEDIAVVVLFPLPAPGLPVSLHCEDLEIFPDVSTAFSSGPLETPGPPG